MAIELRYRIVDVFSDRPLAGNGLCVVLDPVPEPVMQALAAEVNLSETTFPVVVGDREYENRIFTPLSELPFAGHPSLGTAWVLGPGRWTQRTSGATVIIDVDDRGAVMDQPEPSLQELSGGDAWLAEAGGTRHVIVPCADQLLVDLAVHEDAPPSTTLSFMRPIDDATLHVRAFVRGARTFEDPGTGSLAGPAAVLARRLWGTGENVTIQQGDEMGRPCRITVDVSGDRPRVGGHVAACAAGTFTL